ncbi:DUF6766 family protein [Pedobacter sp. GSP4]|uniref:DUF6766 family protein n=1 Tax=Pedobacter sp. GSP4 TaxID=3453716 RepID=UPI003EEC98F4
MSSQKTYPKKTWLYRNGLSVVFITIFLITLMAQALTGWREHNSELADHGAAALTLRGYLTSGHFISATFENFESEFLQMMLYVLLTVKLRQLGSAESKKLDEKEEVDREPTPSKHAPWAVRQGGWILKVYSHSLSIAFGVLFLSSWALHFYGSWQENNISRALLGKPRMAMSDYLAEANFWFETFQNWQSEFLSVAAIVILTIFLREKGSPESKPVDAPNLETGK